MLWEQAILSLSPAKLSGSALYDLDWYPMLVNHPGTAVDGLLVSVQPNLYGQVLSRLDFLEGYDPAEPGESDYRREKRIVTLSGGESVVAWVYVGDSQLVQGRPQIQTNWIAHIQHNRRQVGEWWRAVQSVGRGRS